MRAHSTNNAETLALSALAATLTDERRAQRFLDLSGIDTDDLRSRAADPDDVADAIGAKPADLVAAREELDG